MYYSRPPIEPLGWDLSDWPRPESSRFFDACTSDRRPVHIRFSGGWLTVERGPIGAPRDSDRMEEILCRKIAPFGTMDIEPEQICDILGITVNGNRIDSAGVRTRARGFDWSGQTTYWESTHLMQHTDDAREFVQRLCDAFPGAILLQAEWGSHGLARYRQIRFLMASDRNVTVGVGPDPVLFEKVMGGQRLSIEESESLFAFRIAFLEVNAGGGAVPYYGSTEDLTGVRYILQHGARELGLKFDVIHHRRYRLDVQYPTRDLMAQSRMKTLLSVIDASFRRGLEVVNLQTGARVAEDIPDDSDRWRYSVALREEWLTKPERYFYVSRSASGDAHGFDPGIFWGARPKR